MRVGEGRLSVRRQGLRKRLGARLRPWSRCIDEEAPTDVAAGSGFRVQEVSGIAILHDHCHSFHARNLVRLHQATI